MHGYPPPLDMRNSWINGRTLKMALARTRANHTLACFGATDRVPIDPQRDAYLLGAEFQNPFPFSTGQGVMATVRDAGDAAPVVYEFGRFQFTASAFESSLHWIQAEDAGTGIDTPALEALGREVLAGASHKAHEFSRQVCQWGRGKRVWGNLNRHYTPQTLAQALGQWFQAVAQAHGDAAQAIEWGISIKGLHVSFASKHLRLLAPDRYAVLDEVLSVGLGYALNPAGYALFMHTLRAFQRSYGLPYTLAQIEWAIFGLVRQSVRGLPSSSLSISSS